MRPLWPRLRFGEWLTRRNVLVFTAGAATGLAGWWLFGPDPTLFCVVVVGLAFYVDWLVRR